MQAQTAAAGDTPIFRALLTPYRSLGPRGFRTVMLGLGGISATAGVVFLAHGAWPILGFFGLDILILWLALRSSYRSARAHEEVVVSRSDLVIRKVSAQGGVEETSYNPFWARLQVSRHSEIGVTRMAVAAGPRRTEIGAFLNPADRESFAAEFGRALAKARRG